jgi:uncharacterized membrane protein HdeD (DUF308 family)
MTMPSPTGSLGDALRQARAKWGWFVALGVLLLVVGGIAAANLMVATVASVFVVGSLMLIGGIGQIVHAFSVKDWGGFAWWLLSGILYAVSGVIAFMNPLLASAVLTLLLAASLLASGALRVWVGLKERPNGGWGWVVAGGAVTVLLGLIIAMGWPVNSLWVLGMFLAIDMIFQGWTFIAVGLALKK